MYNYKTRTFLKEKYKKNKHFNLIYQILNIQNLFITCKIRRPLYWIGSVHIVMRILVWITMDFQNL